MNRQCTCKLNKRKPIEAESLADAKAKMCTGCEVPGCWGAGLIEGDFVKTTITPGQMSLFEE